MGGAGSPAYRDETAAAARSTAVRFRAGCPWDDLLVFDTINGLPVHPLVVHAVGGFFTTSYQYLTSYKGLAFFAKSSAPLTLPSGTELVQAKKIWIPG